MLFFQSEETLNEWLVAQKSRARRGTVHLHNYGNFHNAGIRIACHLEYHGRTIEQAQKIFKELGLTSEFWQAV